MEPLILTRAEQAGRCVSLLPILPPSLEAQALMADSMVQVKQSKARWSPRIQSEMHVDMHHVKELVEVIARPAWEVSFHLVRRHDPIATDAVSLRVP